MTTLQKETLLQKRGQDLYDTSGDKIGKIEEIYLDAQTGEPEWALVNTGLFGTKSSFVPLQQATDDGGTLRVPYEKSQVKDAPKMDPDGELSQSDESALYQHYGLDYSESRSDSGLPEGGSGANLGTDTEDTGTVRVSVSVVTYLRSRARPASTRSVPTRSCSSERVIALSVVGPEVSRPTAGRVSVCSV